MHRAWLLLVLPLLLGACLREPPDPGARDERVVVLLETPPRDLDPRYASDASSTKVSRLIHCGLYTLETEDLRPLPEAARALEPACPDGPEGCRHWVVTLRDDVYWHDGVSVSPEDVVFTYRSLLEGARPSPFRGELQRRIQRVWAEKDKVHFQLSMPYASFPVDLAIGLVPAHILQPQGGLDGQFDDEMIGCGPFRLHSRYRDQKVVLERNDLYWQPVKPRFVVVRTVPDEATRVLSVMAGSGHIVVNAISPPVVRRLKEMDDVEVLHRPAACTTYLAFNLLDKKLADRRVRHAIAAGIDRQMLVDEQFRGMAQVAHSILPPLHWAYYGDILHHDFDPERARRLLDEAGLVPDPETGVRAHFTLKVTPDFFRKNIGSLVAYKLGRIGIEVELLPLELSTFLADVRKGNFEMYILQLPQVIEPDILRWLLYSQAAPTLSPQPGTSPFGRFDRTLFPPRYREVEGPLAAECRERWFPLVLRQALENHVRLSFGVPAAIGSGNRSFYADPTLDCALDLGNLAMTEEARLPYYRVAQEILARDIPVLPLWHEDNVAVVRKEIKDYQLLPLNRYSPVINVDLEL